MKSSLPFLLLLVCPFYAIAQDSSLSKLEFSAYLELYYSYDFAQPANHEKPSFFYNYTRHNEINLNLGFLKASYHHERIRANLGLMAGTYAQANLATEPAALRNIFEANAGYRIGKNQLWLDAGVFVSHLGLESAVGRDNWELTRSIVADNSPYYESGIRLSYSTKSEKIYLAGFYLNGWQRIARTEGNQTPALGTQITYKPSGALLVNWSTFIGNLYPDTARRWRYYNNVYAIWQMNPKLGITAAVDFGLEQQQKGSVVYSSWWAPLLILQYKFHPKARIALRGEYYSDKNEVVVQNNHGSGFQTLGCSANFDLLPNKHLLLRIEARWLQSEDALFLLNNLPDRNNYCLSACIALTL